MNFKLQRQKDTNLATKVSQVFFFCQPDKKNDIQNFSNDYD